MITGMRGQSAAALIASGMLVAAALAGCGSSADAGSPSASALLSQPLPGSDAASARLGIITQRYQNQTLELPGRFSGLTDEQIVSLTSSIARVGDRSITVVSTPIILGSAPEDGPAQDAAKACIEQRGSSIVITDVADPDLVDCLTRNGSVVIDASAQPWDTKALVERAPFVWASATAPADVAERVLLAQAKAAGLLLTGPATIVAGPDTVTQRVAATITTPELTSQGLAPQTITIGGPSTTTPAPTPADEYAQRDAAVDQAIAAGTSGVVRPISPLVYAAMTSNETFNRASSTILITSTSWPGRPLTQGTLSSGTKPIAARTSLLGWSPPTDGTAQADTPAAGPDATSASACQAALGQQSPPVGQQEAWPRLFRMCDAVNLARTALAAPGVPTAAGVRDAIWNAPTAWRPAAVTANGWALNSYTGANLARWFAWNPACQPLAEVAPDGCFTPTGQPIPLPPN